MRFMKKLLSAAAAFSASIVVSSAAAPADYAPAVKLFAYGQGDRLFYAWNADGLDWHGIDRGWIGSDYGAWGGEKKMHAPYLFRDTVNSMWYCIFTPNPQDPVFALAASPDLVNWHVQNYHTVSTPQCLDPFIAANKDKSFNICWHTADGKSYTSLTRDFKKFGAAKAVSPLTRPVDTIVLNGREMRGNIVTVSKADIDRLTAAKAAASKRDRLTGEGIRADLKLPASVAGDALSASVTVDLGRTKAISPLLWGIFFEDINYAADGGLYAELVRNRDFEFNNLDRGEWNAMTAWTVPQGVSTRIETANPVHKNNPHYLVIEAGENAPAITNNGFSGMVFRTGDSYLFNVFANCPDGNARTLKIELRGNDGKAAAAGSVKVQGKEWKKYSLKLTASESTDRGQIALIPPSGALAVDMVSLFPEKTFKGRKNGLRADLAQTLADLKPGFVRFPGGCVAHGNGLNNMYRWNRTVGPLEARVPQSNLWGYHQTAGLGYFEYFQFCEDIGAEPLPVLPAAVPCQNSSRDGKGQQGGIPMADMPEYIQEVLDLVEWANGPADSKWGSVRAKAGHPAPFNLKYIGIGNEDLIGDVFCERFTMIFNAVRAKHPEITIVGTVGPFFEGSDYEDGWALARKLGVPIVDEHYYQSPGWFINNQNYYDHYERNGTRVYLGEYASHNRNRTSTMETALTEAIYMISLERNGDVVAMSSYAPLLAKEGNTQWNPDLIYFNNTQVKPTTGYYVQQLFGNHSGDRYANTSANLLNAGRPFPDEDAFAPFRARFSSSCVIDSKTKTATVKIANLLPFEFNTKLKLDNLAGASVAAKKIVMAGDPGAQGRPSQPVDVQLGSSTDLKIPAFSLTVLTFPVK